MLEFGKKRKIKAHAPQAQKGIFQRTLYKLKKKFL